LIELRFESTLPAPIADVWDRIASMEGINDELRPWMRMTAPRGAELTAEAVPLGERWFRSWILAFGVIPIDYDDLCLLSVDPPHGFHERSSMLSARVWVHKRSLVADGDGTRLVDELGFEPRRFFFAPILRALIPRVFRHRHKRLRRYFS
jgi:ligand-binding SRPBCC domain-containing protein